MRVQIVPGPACVGMNAFLMRSWLNSEGTIPVRAYIYRAVIKIPCIAEATIARRTTRMMNSTTALPKTIILPISRDAKTHTIPDIPMKTKMIMIEPEPTILSPQVLLISATDSFTASMTPLSSRMRIGTTKNVTRLQIPPISAAATLPIKPARRCMRCRRTPTVAETSAHKKIDGRCCAALDSPSQTDSSLP
jgi:hypothetical protein